MKLENLVEKSDDGRVVIPKWFIVTIVIIVAVVTAAGSIGAQQAEILNDIEDNKEDIKNLEEETKQQQSKINRYNRDIAVIKEMLNNIQNNVKKLSEDSK